jgi:putative membrane protein
MIRFLVRTGILLVANAVGLLVAAAVLDDMEVNAQGFIIAVAIFTIVVAVMTPFLANMFRKSNSAALGGVALIATLVSLVITDWISDGFTINGLGTFVIAAVIVWVASLLAAFILPYLGLKKYLADSD